MTWYTVEQLQELADRWGKAICAWHPLECEFKNHEGKVLWIKDRTGRVKDFTNPLGEDSKPWRDKYSWKMIVRPIGTSQKVSKK